MQFIHKALTHKSPLISSVTKLSIQNPRSNCGGRVSYEYNMREDASASVIGRVWQAACLTKGYIM